MNLELRRDFDMTEDKDSKEPNWKNKKLSELTPEEMKEYNDFLIKQSQESLNKIAPNLLERFQENLKKQLEQMAKVVQPIKTIKIPDFSTILTKSPDVIREENEWARHGETMTKMQEMTVAMRGMLDELRSTKSQNIIIIALTIFGILMTWLVAGGWNYLQTNIPLLIGGSFERCCGIILKSVI